ncbi:hypothetical protein [Mesorhizobium silamurunense]|uniref:hypothetical protein n=1 Tax=Mesorhizobium silamurunense TaxID=499528 RepID=UPI0017876D9D|nr:hypothetical protein [Mesorhizobium silamurunense]
MLSGSGLSLAQVAANIGAGGGGSPYVAEAVHVATGTGLGNPSLVATGDDTGYLTYVYWFKMSGADFGNQGVMWVQDPENFYPGNSYFSDGGGAGIGFIHLQACASQDENCISATIGATPSDPGKTVVPLDTWVPLLVSIDTNRSPTSSMVLQAYLGDTQVLYVSGFEPSTYYSTPAPFFQTWNGLSLHFFDDVLNPATVSGDFADIWFAPGQFIDFSVEANRRKFVDASGKPVYLGANGEMPTGTAPAVFFSGDATGFATNKGTGGAFTLTGSLTNATTSPSD